MAHIEISREPEHRHIQDDAAIGSLWLFDGYADDAEPELCILSQPAMNSGAAYHRLISLRTGKLVYPWYWCTLKEIVTHPCVRKFVGQVTLSNRREK